MALKTLLHVGCGPLTLANTTQGFGNDGWREIRMDVDESVKPDVLGTITDMRAVAGRDKPFMAHHCGFTASTLQDALLGCGFAMVGIVRSGWMLRAVACMQALERPELDALARRYLK